MLRKILLGIIVLIASTIMCLIFIINVRHEKPPSTPPPMESQVYDENFHESATQAEAWLQNLYYNHSLPSVSVAVGVGGERVWAGAIGYANIDNEERATTNTLYRIGSISKSLTATAAMILHENKILDIDHLFSTIAPEIASNWEDFSLYQLATHQAGIRHYPDGLGFYQENFSRTEYPTTEHAVITINQQELLFKPGSRFHYSTYGYTLLALAMEKAVGKTYERLMEEYVFNVAGMNTTLLDKARTDINHKAEPYLQIKNSNFRAPEVNLSYKYAGGGYLSTPTDIVRFGNALLSGALLSNDARAKLWQVAPLNDGNTNREHYSMGFTNGRDAVGRNHSHGGMSVGGFSYFVVYPEQQIVIAIATNATPMSGQFSRSEVALQLAEIFNNPSLH